MKIRMKKITMNPSANVEISMKKQIQILRVISVDAEISPYK